MKILLVDDDKMSLESMNRFINNILGLDCTGVNNPQDALELLQKEVYDLIFTDFRMPGMTGYELLKWIKTSVLNKNSDVVVVTAMTEIKPAIDCMQAGAYQYILKPVSIDEMSVIIMQVSERRALRKTNEMLSQSHQEYEQKISSYNEYLNQNHSGNPIGFYSERMQHIQEMVQTLNRAEDVPVLIEGETGTGKEIIARMLHTGTKRRGPFVTINCSAITPSLFESELFGYSEGAFTGATKAGRAGQFELAQHGTVFLDEIGDMPLEMQPKILRVLQEREVVRVGGVKPFKLNVRIISATNRDLLQEVESGRFRRDLYYRLHTGYIHIPPLRERRADIENLSVLYLKHYAAKRKKEFVSISNEAMKMLLHYDWPGNVRELKNAMDRVTLLYNDVLLKPLHLAFLAQQNTIIASGKSDFGITIDLPKEACPLETIENQIIEQLLIHFKGNKTQTAKYLSISRNRLKRKQRV